MHVQTSIDKIIHPNMQMCLQETTNETRNCGFWDYSSDEKYIQHFLYSWINVFTCHSRCISKTLLNLHWVLWSVDIDRSEHPFLSSCASLIIRLSVTKDVL